MRESVAELERLINILTTETNGDKDFLQSLLDHKNITIGWVRERHDYEIAQFNENIERINQQFNSIVSSLEKEIAIIEAHLRTFKGVDKRG
jgi:hypothetical protein